MKSTASSKLDYKILKKLNVTFLHLGILISLISLASCSKDIPPTEEEIKAEIQNRLDAGETPLEIYNNREIPSSYEYFFGLYYGGGIIIYFDESDGSGLIVSSEDLERSTWGCHGEYIEDLPVVESLFNGYGSTPPPLEGSQIGDGLLNTKIIVGSACGDNSAAKICDDYVHEGYDDWFLPSIAELSTISYAGVHGEYWTSTVKDSTSAAYYFEYYLDRSYGSTNNCFCFPTPDGPPGRTSTESRDVVKDVRAVRTF